MAREVMWMWRLWPHTELHCNHQRRQDRWVVRVVQVFPMTDETWTEGRTEAFGQTDRLKNRSMSEGAEQVMLKNETENRASGRMRADRDDGTSALPTSIINTDRSHTPPHHPPTPTPPPLKDPPPERGSGGVRRDRWQKRENQKISTVRWNTARRADGRGSWK